MAWHENFKWPHQYWTTFWFICTSSFRINCKDDDFLVCWICKVEINMRLLSFVELLEYGNVIWSAILVNLSILDKRFRKISLFLSPIHINFTQDIRPELERNFIEIVSFGFEWWSIEFQIVVLDHWLTIAFGWITIISVHFRFHLNGFQELSDDLEPRLCHHHHHHISLWKIISLKILRSKIKNISGLYWFERCFLHLLK